MKKLSQAGELTLNKTLTIERILITMVDYRTNYAKDITAMLRENYGMDEDIGVSQNLRPGRSLTD